MFVCSSLLVLIYDVPPGVGITHDLEFESPSEEKLWNAATAEEWRSLNGLRLSSPRRTIRSVMEDMLAGKTNDNAGNGALYYVSGFTTLIIIHALNMYAWNLSQLSQICMSQSSDLSGVTSNTLVTNALHTFARCHEVLELAKPSGIESFWNNPEGPLLLNCEAMLRVAYTRLFLSGGMPEGLVLLLNPPSHNVRLLEEFVASPQERTPLINKVMANMCEAFSVPAKAGYLLVQKTAAINWSVEHAVAGWGCGMFYALPFSLVSWSTRDSLNKKTERVSKTLVLLLSRWLHCLDVQLDETPPSDTESEVISHVKLALEGMGVDYDDRSSLAAAVVSSWAPLMTDVSVLLSPPRYACFCTLRAVQIADILDANTKLFPGLGLGHHHEDG